MKVRGLFARVLFFEAFVLSSIVSVGQCQHLYRRKESCRFVVKVSEWKNSWLSVCNDGGESEIASRGRADR